VVLVSVAVLRHRTPAPDAPTSTPTAPAPGVRAALTAVFRARTGTGEADAEAWFAGLRAGGRYLEDIWARPPSSDRSSPCPQPSAAPTITPARLG
jgi:hypothetical protein